MNNCKRVAFATGSRADYGIVRRYLELMNSDSDIALSILVTGALLDEKYGRQVELIYKDGFSVGAELKLPISTETNFGIVHCMAVAMDDFGEHFCKNEYDLLIILGDRYEMLSVAIAAAMQRIPILHLHGGEATFGNYDEFIRHCITKMSRFHFTATEEYRKRVIQLGENPENVFYLGALGAENCLDIRIENVPTDVRALQPKSYFVILFHPETLTNVSTTEQTAALLSALEGFSSYKLVFIGSNADTHSDEIRTMVKKFVEANENCIYYENLHTDAYHYLVRESVCLIGNSSSGIIEAPSLGVYTVNIGNRQAGRVRGNSVIDTPCDSSAISDAVNTVLSEYKTANPENPYYKENSAKQYYEKTVEILSILDSGKTDLKIFYDL